MPSTDSLNQVLGVAGTCWTVVLVAATIVLLYLILRSGHGYSVEDTEAHATEYAGVIKEGHGGMTAFLWIAYAAMALWTIAYLVQHADEFGILFA